MKWMGVLLLFFALPVFAHPGEPFALDFGGRTMPEHSLGIIAADLFCGKKTCAGTSARHLPELIRKGAADTLNVFRVNRHSAVDILHLDMARRNFCRGDFFQSRSLLRQYAERDDSHPLTRELKRLDAALDLYDSLQSESFWNRISRERAELSPEMARRVDAERLYLAVDLPFIAWMLVCISFVFSVISFAIQSTSARIFGMGVLLQTMAALSMFAVFIWRGIVTARIPLVNLYEILLVISFGFSVLTLFGAMKEKSRGALAGGTAAVFVCFFLMRFALSSGDPFGNVSQILDSPFWLSLHVFTIASGFCLLLTACFLAHAALWRRFRGYAPSKQLVSFLNGSLWAGFALSVAGTLIGGFWADVAWGRFWGWDPKENGALLVLLWVLIVMHLKVGKLASPKTIEILVALLSIVIAFCLFGVNLLGVGLHSYGYSPGLFACFWGFVIVDLLAISALSLGKMPGRAQAKDG